MEQLPHLVVAAIRVVRNAGPRARKGREEGPKNAARWVGGVTCDVVSAAARAGAGKCKEQGVQAPRQRTDSLSPRVQKQPTPSVSQDLYPAQLAAQVFVNEEVDHDPLSLPLTAYARTE